MQFMCHVLIYVTRTSVIVYVKGHMWWLNTIVYNLSNNQMNILQKSAFGHLFDIPNMQFQGQIFNVLLCKLRGASTTQDMLEFIFDDAVPGSDFWSEEFRVMTRLRFTIDDHLLEESEFHQRFFNGKCPMVLYDIYT